MSTLGERLRILRSKAGWTQKEVSEAIGMSREGYANWEIGRTAPDAESLERLAQLFGVSVDYILGISDIPDPAERIAAALNDDPELAEFWRQIQRRENLKLLFKQVKNLSDEDIRRVIRVIKAIEEEESEEPQ